MTLRLARAATVMLLAVVAGAAVPAAAHAAGTAGHCPDGNGVTVVVDFNELGGGVVIRCAAGEQATGHAALKNAGFTIAGTNRWGEAFVCRINGKPGPAAEPCIDTPPATAYWSYWHAGNGGGWTYSDKGVMNRKPPLGSFEGWSFSKNHTEGTAPRPGADPSRPAPPPPPPPPAPTGGVQTTPANPAATTGAARTTASDMAAATPTATVASMVASTAAAPSGTQDVTADTSAAPVGDTATRPTGSGVPLGTLAGAGLLLLIAVAGGVTMWRRRSADPDGGS